MEKNFIGVSRKTCFYVDLVNKNYGACINIKEVDKSEELIKEILESNKNTIQAWKKEWEKELENV